MDEFDLGRLTDFDFEKLCKDIFEQILDLRLELFAPGPDTGIDLRGFTPDNGELIAQCKHWPKTGRSKLLSHFRKEEAAKVHRLKPTRYLLATTADLTIPSKSTLQELLTPYLRSTTDIYGVHEVEAYLRDHSEIVTRHIRLWLSSAAVLGALLNRDVNHRTQGLLDDIEQSLQVYVPSTARDIAKRILDREHACLIAGLPGIGKTTLAHVLLAEHAANGYAIIDASWRFDDLDRTWSDNQKQIFFVDDFLGQTMLDVRRAEDLNRGLARLLRNCRASDNKRVVLTSREYILTEARERFERLAHYNLDPTKCVIDMANYTVTNRAEILYNHVYFSKLSPEQRAAFAEPAAYQRIIHHKNYSPRLLEHALLQATETDLQHDPVQAVLENLNNPHRLWERLIESVLTEDELNLILALYSINDGHTIEYIETAWLSLSALTISPTASRRFRTALKTLEHTMIRRIGHTDQTHLMFHNPSIRDYLNLHVQKDPNILCTLLATAVDVDQLVHLWQTIDHAESTAAQVFHKLIESFLRLTHSADPNDSTEEWDQLAIEIINSHYDPRLEEWIVERLSKIEEDPSLFTPSELFELALRLADSELISLWCYLPTIAAYAAEQFISITHSWADLESIEWHLGELEEIANLEFKQDLEEKKFELADDMLNVFVGSTEPEHINVADLQEVLDYWESNQTTQHPGTEAAYAYLDAHASGEEEPSQDENHPTPDEATIDAMFRTLHDDHA